MPTTLLPSRFPCLSCKMSSSLGTTVPWEILSAIFLKINDAKTALTVTRVCKATYHLLRPTKQRPLSTFWKQLREKDGWPDPSAVSLSNYTFLLTVYGRGCCNCSSRPHIRSPLWQLYGLRLCSECVKKVTCSENDMQDSDGRKVLSYYFPRAIYSKERRFLKHQVDDVAPVIDDLLSTQYETFKKRIGYNAMDWSRILDSLQAGLRPVLDARALSIQKFAKEVKRNKHEKSRRRRVDKNYMPPILRARNLKSQRSSS